MKFGPKMIFLTEKKMLTKKFVKKKIKKKIYENSFVLKQICDKIF